MAKVTGPLMSMSATGQLGGQIIFAGLGKGSRAYKLKPPKGTGNPARKILYAEGCAAWQALTAPQKADYVTAAKPLKLTGFNLYMREWMSNTAPQNPTSWDQAAEAWDTPGQVWDFV
jgi:hypothetical protein